MADYTIPHGTTNWDVPLNADLTDIDSRLTTGETTNAAQDSSISTLNTSVAALQSGAGSGNFSVDINMNSHKVTGMANGTAASDAAAFGQVPVAGTTAGTYAAGNDSRITGALQTTGGTMSGAIAMGTNKITGLGNGSAASDAAAFGQIPVAGTTAGTFAAGNDSRITGALQTTGGTMSGAIAMGTNKITGLGNGSAAQDAAAFGQIPTSASTVTAETSYGVSSNAGAAATFSRGDHTHGTPAIPSTGAFSSVSESNSTTTQQASPNLVAAVAANATYLMRMNLLVSQASSSFVHTFTGPTGATMVWADNSGSVMATLTSTDTWSSIASRTITLTGKLITSSTAGNLTFTFASGTGGQTVTVQPGGEITLERIA